MTDILQYNGALLDERPVEEKERDFQDEEIATSSILSWQEKEVSELPFFEVRDQAQSGTCVAQAVARAIGISVAKASGANASMSATGIYNRRYNQPADGMAMFDVFNIAREFGATFEALEPSQRMSEREVTSFKELPYTKDVARNFRAKSYAYVGHNIDAIAQAIDRDHNVILFIHADIDEYQINPRLLRAKTPANSAIRHAVLATAYFTYNKKRYLLIEDSWGVLNSKNADNAFERELAKRGQRMFAEEFVNARVYGAGYLSEMNFLWSEQGGQVVKPRYSFNRDLEYGLRNDPDVKALQDILKVENCLSSDIDSTGNYLGLTMAAVQTFQRKHGIVSSGTPASTGYGRVGPLTRKVLNNLYK